MSATTSYAERLLTQLHPVVGDITVPDDPSYVDDAAEWIASGCADLSLQPDAPVATAARGALLAFRALAPDADLPDSRVLSERAALGGPVRQATRLLECRDGWLTISLPRDDDLAALPALVEADVDDPWTAVEKWCRDQTAHGAADRAQLLGIAAAALDHPTVESPFRLSSLPTPRSPATPPLVVDLSSLWAGPTCSRLLGLAGARVIKVESAHRPDGARQGSAEFYERLHHGHESRVIDFRSPVGVEEMGDLLVTADVVIEASRPRALQHLGIDPYDVSPRCWVSITAYGRTGPWSDRVGFGDDTAVAGGLVAWENGLPTFAADAVADPLAGIHAAVAAQACLVGDGAHLVDVSLRDVAAYVAAS